MRRTLVLVGWLFAAVVGLSGCARLFAEPDWKFDCEWARFRDFQEAAQGRLSRGNWTKMLCDVDPSSIDYWSARRRQQAEVKK
jgi:hypothetical protein